MKVKSDNKHSLYDEMGLVRIVELDPDGRAILEYNAREEMCHSGGVVQGGFVTGWIDAAMAHAATALHGSNVVAMSLELKVSFFAPTRPGLVIAEGWVEKPGRKTEFCEGLLRDSGGKVLAKATSTILLADLKRIQKASRNYTNKT